MRDRTKQVVERVEILKEAPWGYDKVFKVTTDYGTYKFYRFTEVDFDDR